MGGHTLKLQPGKTHDAKDQEIKIPGGCLKKGTD